MDEPTEMAHEHTTRFMLRGLPALAIFASIVTVAAAATGLLVTSSAVAGDAASGTYPDGSPSGPNLGAIVSTAQTTDGDTTADLIGVTPGGAHVLISDGSQFFCYNADLGGKVVTPIPAAPGPPNEWVVGPSGGLFYEVAGYNPISIAEFTVHSDCSVTAGFKVSLGSNALEDGVGISKDGSKLYVLVGGSLYAIAATTGQFSPPQYVDAGILELNGLNGVFKSAHIGPILDEAQQDAINHSSVNANGTTLTHDPNTDSTDPATFIISKHGKPVTTIVLGSDPSSLQALWMGKDMHHIYAATGDDALSKQVVLIDASAPRIEIAPIVAMDAALAALVLGLWVLAAFEPRWRPRFLAAREQSRQENAAAEEAYRLRVEESNKRAEALRSAGIAEAKRLAQERTQTTAGQQTVGVGQPAPGVNATVVPQSNGFALASIIVVWFLPLAGAILGHIALGQINRLSETGISQSGRGLALAAVIIGWVSIALGAIFTIVYIAIAASALH